MRNVRFLTGRRAYSGFIRLLVNGDPHALQISRREEIWRFALHEADADDHFRPGKRIGRPGLITSSEEVGVPLGLTEVNAMVREWTRLRVRGGAPSWLPRDHEIRCEQREDMRALILGNPYEFTLVPKPTASTPVEAGCIRIGLPDPPRDDHPAVMRSMVIALYRDRARRLGVGR